MKLLFINSYESQGGAAKIAQALYLGVRARGCQSTFLVQKRQSNDPDVFEIPDQQARGKVFAYLEAELQGIPAKSNRLQTIKRILLRYLLYQKKNYFAKIGKEYFDFPGIKYWIDNSNRHFDLIHLHNLHPNYFDLSYLPLLTRKFPVIMTLHDAWIFSGHCAHFVECNRWQTGCGQCPDLQRYPAVLKDCTAENWRQKALIYRKSHLNIVGPSQWIIDCAQKSILSPAIVRSEVINNGIDLTVFVPGDKTMARNELALPSEAKIVLSVAAGLNTNFYKDYETFNRFHTLIDEKWRSEQPLIVIGLGATTESTEVRNRSTFKYVSLVDSPSIVAQYYRAADVYIHTARADTFPTTILEAMACGLPVVASKVGGIPEQVLNEITGYTVESGNAQEVCEKILLILQNDELRIKMGLASSEYAKKYFNRNRMLDLYVQFFKEVQNQWQREHQNEINAKVDSD